LALFSDQRASVVGQNLAQIFFSSSNPAKSSNLFAWPYVSLTKLFAVFCCFPAGHPLKSVRIWRVFHWLSAAGISADPTEHWCSASP